GSSGFQPGKVRFTDGRYQSRKATEQFEHLIQTVSTGDVQRAAGAAAMVSRSRSRAALCNIRNLRLVPRFGGPKAPGWAITAPGSTRIRDRSAVAPREPGSPAEKAPSAWDSWSDEPPLTGGNTHDGRPR